MKPFLLLFLFVTISCNGQNTLSFQEGTTSPKASLTAISWMEGHWKGEAFGGITEEIWSPPLGGSMMFSFKLVIDGQTACVWGITFTDPQIWEERDKDPSIYIHRIATNPDFRGQKFVTAIVNWARSYAKSRQKKFIRMDTCGNNQKLIKHYSSCGFDFLGMVRLKNADELPSHYQDADVCLFEIKLN